jgi:addiction module HigA family antidote
MRRRIKIRAKRINYAQSQYGKEALKKYEFEPDYATPPGATLLEVMESLEMTQKELAVRTGLTEQTLTRIFKGNQPISYETANRLELVTQVPAGMWNNLEAQYREQLAKLEERQRLDAEKTWLKTIPTKELIERGYLEAGQDEVSLLRNVLSFFGVSSVMPGMQSGKHQRLLPEDQYVLILNRERQPLGFGRENFRLTRLTALLLINRDSSKLCRKSAFSRVKILVFSYPE